jgi:hypothetical protein
MENIFERLSQTDELVGDAMSKVAADTGSSPVLNAVMKEFHKKSKKALGGIKDADERTTREFILEVEQAADSAKAAVEADRGAAEVTRKAVLDAHLSICVLKSEL